MADENRPTLFLECAFGVDNPFTIPTSLQYAAGDISGPLRTDELSIRRGRSDELSQFSAGTATFTLNNTDGRFDPRNSAGPHYPNVVPMRRVRLRAVYAAVSYTLFTGFAMAWTPTYDPQTGQAITILRCVDMMGALLAHIPLGAIVIYDGPWGTDPDSGDELGSFFNYQPAQATAWGGRPVKVTAYSNEVNHGSKVVGVEGVNASSGLDDTEGMIVDIDPSHNATTPMVMESAKSWSSITRIRITQQTGVGDYTPYIRVETGDYPTELAGVSASRVMDTAGIASLERVTSATLTTVPAWTPAEGSTAHAALVRLAQAEQGFYYITRDGLVAFLGRSFRMSLPPTPSVTLSSATAPYANMRLNYDEKFLYPIVRAARQGGAVQEARDVSSVTHYGPRVLDIGSLLVDNDNTAAAYAEAMLFRYKDPAIRIDQIALQGELKPAACWPVILNADIGSYVQITGVPPGSVLLQKNVFVEQISFTIRGHDWQVQWATSPADQELIGFWLLEDATYGVLDTTTRLGW